jgi:16S rRNA (guanine527-N7)-methyltransferase
MVEAEFGDLLGRYIAGLSVGTVGRLFRHYRRLHQWNERMNLTAVPPGEESVRRHFAESLFLGSMIPPGFRTLVDFGSGGGFPGVPIAAWCEGLKVSLVESDVRKCVFLREAAAELTNIEVLCARGEALRGRWDGVVSRAVNVEEVRKFAGIRAKWAGVLTSADIAAKFEWVAVTQVPWEPKYVVAELQVSCETPSAA